MKRLVILLAMTLGLSVFLAPSAQANHSPETTCWLSSINEPVLAWSGSIVQGAATFNCHTASVGGFPSTNDSAEGMYMKVALQWRDAGGVWRTRDIQEESATRQNNNEHSITVYGGKMKTYVGAYCNKTINNVTRPWRVLVVTAVAREVDGTKWEFDNKAGETANLSCG